MARTLEDVSGKEMNDEPEIECPSCGWIGSPEECVCSEEEDKSEKPTSEIAFNRCPQCKVAGQFEDFEP